MPVRAAGGGGTMRPDPEIRRRERAREAVYRAIRRGQLAPASECGCAECGHPAQEYDHVRGYEPAAWLEVEAVCVACHRQRRSSRIRYHVPVRFDGSSAGEVIQKFRAWVATSG